MCDWDHTPTDAWNHWAGDLPQVSSEPQEIDLRGSVKLDFRVKFSYTGKESLLIKRCFLPSPTVWKPDFLV